MSMEKDLALIRRGCVDIVQEGQLRDLLIKSRQEKRPLRVKAGFDPTAADLHLGHTVLLRKMRQFQELGHEVYFLIGDFTGRIGDPSGRSSTRRQLSVEEVAQYAQTYQKQVSRVLDLSKLKVVFNSSWFEAMPLADFLGLMTRTSVSQLLARADFKKRHEGGQEISLLEFMYPLLQGYDSVRLEADIELGGTDQIFNLLMGRQLQVDFGQPPQVVVTMPLLEGTDAVQKMSKSYNNYIGINEPGKEMFGKIMSIPDSLLEKYFELLTEEPLEAVRAMHPRDAKVLLGMRIVEQYHGAVEARRCADEFEKVFSQRQAPADMPEYRLPAGGKAILEVIIENGLAASRNEARRLLSQGGVSFNEERIEREDACLDRDGILRVGKRRFLKVLR